jgi:hypothetical protein
MKRARLHRLLAFTILAAVGVGCLQTTIARVLLVVGLALTCAVGWPTRRRPFEISGRLPYAAPTVRDLGKLGTPFRGCD